MKCWVGFVNIQNSKRRGPLGWYIISDATASPIVHVFLVFQEAGGIPRVYETTETIYESTTLSSRMTGTPCEFFELPLTPSEVAAAYNHCNAMVGSPYDYTAVVGLALMMGLEQLINWVLWPLNKILGVANNKRIRMTFVGNPLNSQHAYFCSESVISALIHTNLFPKWWSRDSIFPHQMYDYCHSRPDLFKEHVW